MSIEPTHVEFLKAFATRDTDRAAALNEQIPNSERRDLNDLVTAFFSIMLEQRFKDDASHSAIRAFVEEMREDYRDATPPIQPLVIEGLIRAASGEEHMLDEIDPHESVRAQYQVIRKIAHQSAGVLPQIDAFVAEAKQLASAWQQGTQ